MDYYKTQALVAQRLRDFVVEPEKRAEGWLAFCRKINLEYGVSVKGLEKRLRTFYPGFTIEKDTLVRIEEE